MLDVRVPHGHKGGVLCEKYPDCFIAHVASAFFQKVMGRRLRPPQGGGGASARV